MSRCGLGSIFEGTKRLRGVPAAHPFERGSDDAEILEGQPGGGLPDLLECLGIDRLARLHDDVPHAELLDEGHHLLLRTGTDRQHRDDGGDAEDHAEHRQERAQLVDAEIVEAKLQVLQPRPEFGIRIRQEALHGQLPEPGFTGPALGPLLLSSAERVPQRDFGADREMATTTWVSVRSETLTSSRLERASAADEDHRLAVLLEERLTREDTGRL